MAKSQSYPETVPAEFTAEDTQEAYRRGWNHGHGIACHNVPTLGETVWTDSIGRVTVDAENIREVHESNCYEAADNSRLYSPFEFTTKEFNDSGEGGFRISNHDTENEGITFETLEEAEQAALQEGYALIREYVWEASGYFAHWDYADMSDDHRAIRTQVYATRQDAMNAANDVGCVAVVEEVSSSEELWEAFERGTGDAIQADLETYDDSDYGLIGILLGPTWS